LAGNVIDPERVEALVAVSGYLIGNQAAGNNPLPPKAVIDADRV
jgi:hypothetical protein